MNDSVYEYDLEQCGAKMLNHLECCSETESDINYYIIYALLYAINVAYEMMAQIL